MDQFDEVLEQILKGMGADDGDASAYDDAARSTYNRGPLIDSDGRTGMGSPWQKLGDKICILFGCDVPVIMRQDGEFWRFIGDAYVHGIMEVSLNSEAGALSGSVLTLFTGEYIEKLRQGGRLEAETQWFKIH